MPESQNIYISEGRGQAVVSSKAATVPVAEPAAVTADVSVFVPVSLVVSTRTLEYAHSTIIIDPDTLSASIPAVSPPLAQQLARLHVPPILSFLVPAALCSAGKMTRPSSDRSYQIIV
jgi:hypothetical protein